MEFTIETVYVIVILCCVIRAVNNLIEIKNTKKKISELQSGKGRGFKIDGMDTKSKNYIAK